MRYLIILIILFSNLILVNGMVYPDVNIPLEYMVTNPGQTIYANIIITKIGNSNREDFDIIAYIVNSNEEYIISKKRVVAVQKELETLLQFDLPNNLEPGQYYIKVLLDNHTSKAEFYIKEKETNLFKLENFTGYLNYYYLIPILLIILIIFFFIIRLHKLKPKEKRTYKKHNKILRKLKNKK